LIPQAVFSELAAAGNFGGIKKEGAMRKMFSLVLGAAVLAGFAPVARGQGEKPAGAGEMDHRFVFEASGSGLAEVNLSRLALTNAMRKEVRDFAQHMVDDHTKANTELLALTNKKGLSGSVAPAMPATHRALSERLSNLRGDDFDRAYMQQMVKDHEDAVKLFETEANSGQDADLKALAKKTLPTLHMHLDMARKVAGVKDTGTKDKGPAPKDKDTGTKDKGPAPKDRDTGTKDKGPAPKDKP